VQSARIRASASAWWSAAATAAVLSASAWLRVPSVQYLGVGATATVVAAVLTFRHGRRTGWIWVTVAALALANIVAVPPQIELRRIDTSWEQWQRDAGKRGLDAMRVALDAAIVDAQRAADNALRAPAARMAAFAALQAYDPQTYERGIVLFSGDSAFAWGGVVRVPVDGAAPGIEVVRTPVYSALRVTRVDGVRRATAVILLDAVSPGDKLAPPFEQTISAGGALQDFDLTTVEAATPPPAGQTIRYAIAGKPLLDIRYLPPGQEEVTFAVRERARILVSAILALALFAFIIAVWRSTRELGPRLAVLAVALTCTAIVPLNQYSNASRLFTPQVYYAPLGRQLTANAGALSITTALALLGLIAVVRTRRRNPSRLWAAVTVAIVAGLGPFLLRALANGIQIPLRGTDAPLWLMWEVPIFLAGVVVLLGGAAAGGIVVGRARGGHPAFAPALAVGATIVGPLVWQAPGQWPWWYTFLWIGSIGALALSRQTRYLIVAVSTVAALGAVTLVWGRSARGRVSLAESDLGGLSRPNQAAVPYLQRFGERLATEPAPPNRLELLKSYVVSDLASAAYPVSLASWANDTLPRAVFSTTSLSVPIDSLRALVAEARRARHAIVRTMPSDSAMLTVLAAPGRDGGVTTVGVAPQSRLFTPDVYASLLGLDPQESTEPPYTVQLRERVPVARADTVARWRREGTELHGDWAFVTGPTAWRSHVEVDLRPLPVLIQRGTLIVILDLGIVAVLWAIGVIADGRAGRWLRARRRQWWRSYRARLSLALFAFFVIPAAVFAIWSYQQLASDARQARELLITETLREATPDTTRSWLGAEGRRLGTPLLLFTGGELRAASDSLVETMAPFGRMLDPVAEEALAENDEGAASQVEPLGESSVLVGFRPLIGPGARAVLAAPARADELSLGRRRRDLGILVLFATVIGAMAAFWLSGIAARQLALPIGNLRAAALSIAGGERVPALEPEPTTEFQPVFTAFRRMATDLHASRFALEEAQRRTAAVLRNVASGVVAVDPNGVVTLANPRAEALIGHALPPGAPLRASAPVLVPLLKRFIERGADEEAFELEIDGRQLHGWTTGLGKGGAVITLDDVTEIARAQRVLAWGEMARQVAHEIKNPLTPIRLGVQHLKRARADRRIDFDKVLDENVGRILGEIDRLDEIARAFSRYGSAPAERLEREPTDVAAVVQDVVGLEQMGAGDGVKWTVHGGEAPALALARRDELKEVLLNILENARQAHARNVNIEVSDDRAAEQIVLTVRDDGAGIPPEILPRVFEPHFSTRTSGSGLGLAISRQIIDGWGGEIEVASTVGKGTTVTIKLRQP
jgi:two-component system nitrogen regulation sensor histidine kinase NtrY